MPPAPVEDPSETPRLDMGRVALTSFMLSGKGTPFYNAARELADQTVGHADDCEWHTNGHGYCSCPTYPAACAGVDATFEALTEAGSLDDHA